MPKTAMTVSPIQQFRDELNLRKNMFSGMLPQHVPVEKFTSNILAAVTMTPALLKCDRASLFRSAMVAANLGLMVDPVLGHAYLIPYGSTVQCIPGYKGLIHLARQSGEIASLYAHEVYQNDTFDMELGTNKRIVHKPLLTGDRGALMGVYAAWSYSKAVDQHGKLAMDFEYMTIADINAIRERSKASGSGPWKTDYVQMARKTVIRRASKYLPLSVQRAAVLDNAFDTGGSVDVQDGEIIMTDVVDVTEPVTEPARAQTEKLAARVAPAAMTIPVTRIEVPQGFDGLDYFAWQKTALVALEKLSEPAQVTRWMKLHADVLKAAPAEVVEAVNDAGAA